MLKWEVSAERSVLLLVILEFGNIWQTHGINIDFYFMLLQVLKFDFFFFFFFLFFFKNCTLDFLN